MLGPGGSWRRIIDYVGILINSYHDIFIKMVVLLFIALLLAQTVLQARNYSSFLTYTIAAPNSRTFYC